MVLDDRYLYHICWPVLGHQLKIKIIDDVFRLYDRYGVMKHTGSVFCPSRPASFTRRGIESVFSLLTNDHFEKRDVLRTDG